MAIKTFDSIENTRFITFSQRYGMMMYVDKRDLVAQIEREWAANGVNVDKGITFSSELQLKMAGELRNRGIEPIRSVDGVFEKIVNSSVTYGRNQAPTEQVKLTLNDEGINYVIALDKDQDIAAQLVIAVGENMQPGYIYDVALYLKRSSNGYKDSHVIIRDSVNDLLRSNAKGYFQKYNEYMKKARALGFQYAEQQGLASGSRAANQVVGHTLDRYRVKFVTELVDHINNTRMAQEPAQARAVATGAGYYGV